MNVDRAILRANPGYELVLLDRLDPTERALVVGETSGAAHLPSIGQSGSPYGILRSTGGSRLESRVVSADTALLFMTLTRPGSFPAYARESLGERAGDTIRRLVLDSVLEIEMEGVFRSGARAWQTIGAADAAASGSPGSLSRTAQLSVDALRYAQELPAWTAEQVARWLYEYGRRPVTPELRRRLSDPAAIASEMVDGRPGTRAALRGWVETSGAADGSPWRSWHPRHPRSRSALPASTDPTFKLYVSPAVEELPRTVEAVASTLADAPGVASWKIGRTIDGLTRPDKLVAYFERQHDLVAAASRLGPALSGTPAHGVPFTAGITTDGLLSWGIDPPRAGGGPSGLSGSWRSWVTERLADYLVAARASADEGSPVGQGPLGERRREGVPDESDGNAPEPWQVALARLRLDGVDVDTWVPTSGAVR
jgi:hypothetical protein